MQEAKELRGFAAKLKAVRLTKTTTLGKRVSINEAGRMFNVSSATYSNWEHARYLPDARSRQRMAELWPEVFKG